MKKRSTHVQIVLSRGLPADRLRFEEILGLPAAKGDDGFALAELNEFLTALDVSPPAWARRVLPLERPYFAAPLISLGLHLLRASPTAFKKRNLFVDSGIGARV